jgi:sugar phosphate isomerase/epimerase
MKVTLHSVGYSGVWGGEAVLTISQFIQKARDLGFDGVEFMGKRPHLSPLDLGRPELKTIREEIQSSGLELPCIASYHDFSHGLDHPDMAALEKELVYLDSVLGMAAELECPIVRVYSGYRHLGVPFENQWEWCVQGLSEACDIAGEMGLTIGLQNHSSLASFTNELLAIVREVGSKNLKIILDAPLLVERGEDIVESVRSCGDLIVHTHTSDYRYVYGREPGDYFTYRRVMAVKMGTGVVDYRTFVEALKEVGFDGHLSYEMCCRLEGGPSEGNLDDLASGALEYSRELIDGK